MRRTVTGFAALAAATLAVQVIGFFVLAVVARRLGDQGLGAFTFAINLAGYFAIPANFGITAFAIRELAQDPERARPVTGEVLALQTALSVLPYLLLVLLAPLLAVDEDSRRLIPIVGVTFLLETWSVQWVLYASQRFVLAAVVRLAGSVVYAVLVVLVIEGPADVLTLGWIHIAGVVATTVLAAWAVLRAIGRPAFGVDPRGLLRRFRAGVPLGVAAVMISVYYTADSLMLGWLRDTATVGQYAVAYKLPLAVLALAGLWGGVLFPHFAALAERSGHELREQLGFFATLSLAASLPLVAGTVLIGPDLVPELFGERFASAGTPFVILMGAGALVLFTVNYGTAAVASGDERHYAYAVSLGAGLNVAANLVLIPAFGMTGAAAATFGAEVVVFVYVAVRLRRSLGTAPLDRDRIARALAATAAMAAVVLLLPGDVAPSVKVATGATVFALCALALRVVKLHELRQIVTRA
jgi:O-antigen/teichoic acid export membrane protein